MKILIIILLFIANHAFGSKFSVMSFNTMCDICKGSSYMGFDKRLNSMRKILKKHNADLISLQEMRSLPQVKELLKGLVDYESVTSEYFLMSYADPTLLYNKKKYKLLDKGQFWLGPREGSFSLGWKFSLPRQVHWIKLRGDFGDFIFVGSHFDNRLENLNGAAKMVNRFFLGNKLPIIFAADTNLTTDMPEYKKLTGNLFLNSFDLKQSFKVIGEYKSDKDLCYTRKGKVFPQCRVDHILLSKNTNWRVKDFIIDATKINKNEFPSDHRPVIVSIEIED